MIFWRDDASHAAQSDTLFAEKAVIGRASLGMILSLLALLIAGTLKLWPLTATVVSFTLPLSSAQAWQATLSAWVPFDAARGEEGVSVQGSILIGLLLVIAAVAWKGFENITEGANRFTHIALALIAATLLVAALRLTPHAGGLDIAITGRFLAVAGCLWLVRRYETRLTVDEQRGWMWESWRFVKQIFPLLVVGVFLVGVVRGIIQPEWIQTLAGRNDLMANAVAVLFGVFMYFPTLVEVPIANMFLGLGMHPGPLLAYLMADPELSLQSILMVSAIVGRTKAFAYVALVAVFSMSAGLIYGAWVDGMRGPHMAVGVSVVAAALVMTGIAARRNQLRASDSQK